MAYRHSVYSALPSAQAFCGDLATSAMFHRCVTTIKCSTVWIELENNKVNFELYFSHYFFERLSNFTLFYSSKNHIDAYPIIRSWYLGWCYLHHSRYNYSNVSKSMLFNLAKILFFCRSFRQSLNLDCTGIVYRKGISKLECLKLSLITGASLLNTIGTKTRML